MFSLLLFVHSYHNAEHRSITTIALSTLFSGIGLLIYSRYPAPIEVVNLMVFNLFVVTGDCFYLVALWQVKQKKVNWNLVIVLVALSVIQTFVFTSLYRFDGLRVAINSLIYATIGFYAFYEFINPFIKNLKPIFILNAVVFLSYCLLMIFRAVFVFRISQMSLMDSNPINISMFLYVVFAQTLAVFSFIVILNQVLSERLKVQIKIRDKFYSIIGHDLRSPISNIQGLCEMTESDDEAISLNINRIRNCAVQTDKLLVNILDWINLQKDELVSIERLDLKAFISDESRYFESLVESKWVRYSFSNQDNVFVMADRNMLKTILRNLVSNAVKFCKKDGLVSVDYAINRRDVVISVSDTGVGIEPEKLKILLTQSFIEPERGTNNEYGTGLGLILCREFAEKQNGKIQVESELGKGSTFKVILPLG